MAEPIQLPNGKWKLYSYKDGKKRSFTTSSKRECKKLEREWFNEMELGKYVKKSGENMQEIALRSLLINTKPSVSLGTFERYMSVYLTHIKDSALGKKSIQKVDKKTLKDWFNTKADMSSKSISLIKLVLNITFEYAIECKLIADNPLHGLKLPKGVAKVRRPRSLTISEQKLYLNAAKDNYYYLLFLFALNTGMRVGEIIALRWDNVDFKNSAVNVIESARVVTEYDIEGNAISNDMRTGKTKTDNSERVIPLSHDLIAALKEHKIKQHPSDFVFTNTKGNQIKYDSIAKSHKLVCQKAGIEELNFHCLRHTFATRCIEIGIDVKTVSKILGHANVKITLDMYVTSSAETKREAIEKMSKLIATI